MFLCRFIYFVIMLLNAIVVANPWKVVKDTTEATATTTLPVINANRTQEGDVPYFVSVKEIFSYGGDGIHIWVHICSGCIISEWKFITAAHCFTTKSAKALRAVTGSQYKYIHHTGTTDSTIDYQWRQLIKVAISDYFFFPYHDVAVAFVDEMWKFGFNVNSLPMAQMDYQYAKPCHTLGFSKVDKKEKPLNESEVLVMTTINVLSKTKCPTFTKGVSNKFVCAPTVNEATVDYESGSPLVCKQTVNSDEEYSRKGLLVGLMSFKEDDMTLYTRISYVYNWINSVSNNRSLSVQSRKAGSRSDEEKATSDSHRFNLEHIVLFILITSVFLIK